MANDLHMRYCVVRDGGRTGISNGTFNPVGFRLVFVGFIYKMAKTKHETLDRKLRILQSTIVYSRPLFNSTNKIIGIVGRPFNGPQLSESVLVSWKYVHKKSWP